MTDATDVTDATELNRRELPRPPRIEALNVKNYRALRNVQLEEMTPLTVLIGPNGSGKSTLFDVFAFLSECFAVGLPEAWARRGGMRELRSRGAQGPITIEVQYQERPSEPLITYHLEIDEQDRLPLVASEWLSWRRGQRGRPFRFLQYERGTGFAIAADATDADAVREEQPLTSSDLLAVNTLGQLKSHPRVAALRSFIAGWYLSYLTAPGLRRARDAGPERRLSATGENLANVLQHLQSADPHRLQGVFDKLSGRVPQLQSVTAEAQRDGSLLLQLKDRKFDEPILARFASDGTMKLLAYLVVLADPDPPPFIGIEEPENFVHPGLLRDLADDLLNASARTQFLVTTHAPQFLDALDGEQVRVLSRNRDGYTTVKRAADARGVKQYLREGGLLGDAWQQQMFDWPGQ